MTGSLPCWPYVSFRLFLAQLHAISLCFLLLTFLPTPFSRLATWEPSLKKISGHSRVRHSPSRWCTKGLKNTCEKYRKINNPEKYGTDVDNYELESQALLKAINDTFSLAVLGGWCRKKLYPMLVSPWTHISLDISLHSPWFLTVTLVRELVMPSASHFYLWSRPFFSISSSIFRPSTGAQARAVLIHAIYSKNLKISPRHVSPFPTVKSQTC